MTPKREVEFFFDYISPYAYLAWEDMKRIAAVHDVQVTARPILFAALLHHNDTRGPAEIESKRRYLFVDILRKAESLDIDINVPASHPFNPLLALRATCAASDEERNDVVSAIYGAVWRDAADTSAAQTYEALGLGALAARASNDEVKAQLHANTEQAIREGIFGVPSLRFEGELFWGVDNLPFLEARLRGQSAPSPEKYAHWDTLKPSASRKLK